MGHQGREVEISATCKMKRKNSDIIKKVIKYHFYTAVCSVYINIFNSCSILKLQNVKKFNNNIKIFVLYSNTLYFLKKSYTFFLLTTFLGSIELHKKLNYIFIKI